MPSSGTFFLLQMQAVLSWTSFRADEYQGLTVLVYELYGLPWCGGHLRTTSVGQHHEFNGSAQDPWGFLGVDTLSWEMHRHPACLLNGVSQCLFLSLSTLQWPLSMCQGPQVMAIFCGRFASWDQSWTDAYLNREVEGSIWRDTSSCRLESKCWNCSSLSV